MLLVNALIGSFSDKERKSVIVPLKGKDVVIMGKLMKTVVCVMLVASVAFVCTSAASAASIELVDQITGRDSGWAISMRTDVAAGEVMVPYVYGVTDDAVIIELDKTFDRPFEGGFGFPLVVEFTKTAADATQNIIIRDEYVKNQTGSTWVDYHMFLMVGLGSPNAGFDPAYVPNGDQLENVYYSGNYGYNGLPIQLNFVDTNGSGVSSVLGNNVFQPGYAGGQIVMVTDPAMAVGRSFGLKEVPTVPEPATIALLGIGAIITIRRRKRSA